MERAARLVLLCHASTAATRTSSFPADEPLDPRGLQKLAAFGRRLSDADHSFTSPALRAVQTAEGLKLDARVEPALRDLDHGRWAGGSFDDVHAEEPDAIAAWLADPRAAPHDGESVVKLIERVRRWLDDRKEHPGLTLAVTHPSVVRAAIVAAIDAGPLAYWRIDVAPLSLTRLSAIGGRWNFVSLSRSCGE